MIYVVTVVRDICDNYDMDVRKYKLRMEPKSQIKAFSFNLL